MAKIFLFTFLLSGLLISSHIQAQKKYKPRWSVVAHLPVNKKSGKQPGLAGVFAGIINNQLIIAGGANFPDSMPWQGGKKIYWADVYILNLNKKEKYKWESNGEYEMKEKIAYGASVQMTEGIVCIGGEKETGISRKVFLMHGNDPVKDIAFVELPELPFPLSNLSAVAIGADIYVAGGETNDGVSNHLLKLNIHEPAKGWVELARIPIEVSHVAMAKQLRVDDLTYHIYLIGGRKKNKNGISDFYSSVFEYDIEKNRWTRKRDMPYPVSAALSTGEGSNEIMVFGGDKGETFHKVETLMAAINAETDETKKQQLIRQKNQLQINHPGFNKDVLIYNIEKDEWKVIGLIPFDSPVTTTVVKGDHKFYIPSGEIKAGIRTTQILMVK